MTIRLRRPAVLLVAVVCCVSFVAGQAARTAPPAAKRVDHNQVWHGQTVNDPYFWLREKANPEVAKYLEAENAYTETMTAGLAPFRDALYKEMLARIKQTDLGVPVRDGKFYYYSRTIEGQQYPLYCRKPMAADGSYRADAPELVMLDQNEMAKGLKFLGLGAAQVSDDGNLLAYSTDTTGFRQYTLHVKALVARRAYPDTAERVTSVEWANDNQTLFYVTEDKVTKRPNQL
jgi:oligopeptidase B